MKAFLQKTAVYLAAAAVCGVLGLLVGSILARGLPHLRWSLFSWNYSSENRTLLPAAINTLTVVASTLLLALPLGIGGAVWLTEYARRGSPVVRLVRTTAQTLAGIPSIIYGLFGYLAFVLACGLGNSLLSGALTLAIMVLPTLLRATEEALRGVPDALRESSYAMGAGKSRTVFRVVLPAAAPGVLSGVILSVGRIFGETAALIYTAGTVTGVADGLFGSGRTLAVHLYCLLNEGLYMDDAYAAAAVLLLMVAGINALSSAAAKRLAGRYSWGTENG